MTTPLVWDVGLSIGVFYGLRALGTSANAAVLGATAAAAVRVPYLALIPRRFDGFAAFILSVWGIGPLLSFVTLIQIACFALLTVYTFVHRTWAARRGTLQKTVPLQV